MEQRLFNNSHILAWLQYYADNTQVDLEKVKLLDITGKNKNLIPTVESHSAVLVFTEAGHQDIFYRMWDAGLGECEVWYNEGSDPSGPVFNKKLKDMISKVTFAIALQESRQALTGCLMEMTPNELRLVGLDGFRLALQVYHDDFVLPDGKTELKAIVPGRVMTELSHIMTDDNAMATFHFDTTHMMAVMGNITLVTSLLAGEYINYRQILPSNWLTRVSVKRKELQEAIERASLMAKEGKNNLIRMKATEGNLKITSNSELGDVLENLDAHLEGEEIEIAFNSRYISDVIKNVDEECCTLSMNTSVSPCVISPLEGESYLYLVLPVRVYN